MIDTSIYNNLLRAPKSVAELDAEAMQGQQNRLALQSSQMQIDAQQRGVQQENALSQAYKASTGADGKIDRNKLYTSVAQSGQGAKLPGMQKGFADQDKADLEAGKAKLEAGLKQFEAMAQIMSGVRDQASYDAARQQALQIMGPEAAARIPPVYNPTDVEAGRLKAMTIKDQMEMHYKEVAAALASDKFKYDQTNDAANRGVTIRGQDKSAASAAASRAQSDRHFNGTPKGQIVQTEDGPILVDPRTGKSIPVLGGDGKPVGKTKAPTEFQGKSAAFGARAEQADKIISALEGNYSPSKIGAKQAIGKAWLVGGALESGANALLGANDQKAEQAQRDFINAVLRQESGAAIGESEFENAKRQYFPQPNDKADVLRQKSENRKLAIKGFQNNAGRAAFSTDAPAPSAAVTLPTGWSVEAH